MGKKEIDYTVDTSDLKDSEVVEGLGDFLEKRLGVKPQIEKKEVRFSLPEGSKVPRREVKAVLKRYLHSAGVKEDFRVLAWTTASFKIKKRSG